ncbi:MAG: glycosyltransferase [Candidatus Bathyarchaeota archaeon]|nr:glycosyltransferase [Candidatus Bathyarchaeota archaeon]
MDIYIPTHNNLEYLKLCLEGIKENSALQNRVIIHNDGCTDGTKEFLESLDTFVTHSHWRGMYSAINQAFRTHSENKYMISLNDDTYPAKNWDVNLLSECERNKVLCPICVEPTPGSFLTYDCGRDPSNFNRERFLSYASTIPRKVEWGTIGQWTLASDLFEEMNGLDEGLDPFGSGGLDLLYRIRVKNPNFTFYRVYDSVVYHFSRIASRKLEDSGVKTSVSKFQKKWVPVNIEAANRLLEKTRERLEFERPEFADKFLGRGLKG